MVEEIKRLIEDGEYLVDAERVALALLGELDTYRLQRKGQTGTSSCRCPRQ
jgi:hypothetical protein